MARISQKYQKLSYFNCGISRKKSTFLDQEQKKKNKKKKKKKKPIKKKDQQCLERRSTMSRRKFINSVCKNILI